MLLKKYDSCGINIKKMVEQLIISFEKSPIDYNYAIARTIGIKNER